MPEAKKPDLTKGKAKFDPNTLDATFRPVYDAMLSEFTTKTQGHAKEKTAWEAQSKEFQRQLDEGKAQMQYYERMLPALYERMGDGSEAAAPQRVNGESQEGEVNWNPFDRGSADQLIRSHLGEYHKMLVGEYNRLVKGIQELQAYNFQLNRVMMGPLYQAAGIEMPDMAKIVGAAPQYGYNLEQAYRAIHESPGVWKRSQEYDGVVKERDDFKKKLDALEAQSKLPYAGVLGGTAGPVPRTVAKGATPKTYAEVAATISPAEMFGGEGAGAGAGTAGPGGGGAAE